MKKQKLSKGYRIYVRRQKARIRRDMEAGKKQDEDIAAIYAKLGVSLGAPARRPQEENKGKNAEK